MIRLLIADFLHMMMVAEMRGRYGVNKESTMANTMSDTVCRHCRDTTRSTLMRRHDWRNIRDEECYATMRAICAAVDICRAMLPYGVLIYATLRDERFAGICFRCRAQDAALMLLPLLYAIAFSLLMILLLLIEITPA